MSSSSAVPLHYKITEQQVADFDRDGFLVIKDFVSKDQIATLRKRMHELIEAGFDLNKHAASVFSTEKDDRHTQDKYFLDSAGNISFFLENLAFDPQTKQLKANVDKFHALNKVGHAFHDKDATFSQFCWNQSIHDLCVQLGRFTKPTIAQSMYIFKPPKLGAKVLPHQDSTFLYMSNQRPCIGFWFAMEDANTQNGGLWAWPGSNKFGLISRWLRKLKDDGNNDLSDNSKVKMHFEPQQPIDSTVDVNTVFKEECNMDKYVPVEVPAGSLVVLHGWMIHKSYDNTSEKSREAMTLHCVDLDADYPAENWLQRDDKFVTSWHL